MANLRALRRRGALDGRGLQALRALADGLPPAEESTNAPPGRPPASGDAEIRAGGDVRLQAPLVVLGLDDPNRAVHLLREQRRTESFGPFRRRLIFVHRDPATLAGALGLGDLRPITEDPHAWIFLGADALPRLETKLRERLIESLPTQVVMTRPPAESGRDPLLPLRSLLLKIEREQRAETEAAQAQIRERLGDPAAAAGAAAATLARAAAGEQKLRVLLISGRFTSYIRHGVHQLAAAWERAGHHPLVLEEPDDSTTLQALSHHRAVLEHRPDLVVAVNLTREAVPAADPALPLVCWIQDPMDHLRAATRAEKRGPLDFFVGHAVQEWFGPDGLDPACFFASALPACPVRFAPPEPTATRPPPDRFACDLALVSNHSQTPEALADELSRGLPTDRDRDHLRRLVAVAERVASIPLNPYLYQYARVWTAQTLADIRGDEAPAETVSRFLHRAVLPLAGRHFRHDTLHLAADAADRRGLTLRIFGTGWEAHPRFGAHAGGPVAHGPELAACYAAAGLHLHADLTQATHQRVYEAGLSGGLIAARLSVGSLTPAFKRALAQVREASGDGPPVGWASVPLGRAFEEMVRDAGAEPEPPPPVHENPDADFSPPVDASADAAPLLGGVWGEVFAGGRAPEPGDPVDAPLLFHDGAALERLSVLLAERGGWRERAAERLSARCHAVGTTDAFLRGLLGGAAAAAGVGVASLPR